MIFMMKRIIESEQVLKVPPEDESKLQFEDGLSVCLLSPLFYIVLMLKGRNRLCVLVVADISMATFQSI